MSKKTSSLGKSLIRDHKKKRCFTKEGYRHIADLPDGLDWARLNLHSVTEQTSVDDFLDKVKLGETEFSKEFENIEIMTPDAAHGLLTENEKADMAEAQENCKHFLCIPRRPHWDSSTTKSELEDNERKEFLDWRRKLAVLKEEKHIQLTPYEKNLEVWRQLWRVLEKSDVIVQILDARNPLLFRCEDLETYTKELDDRKENVLLLNKADFLSEKQREMWASFFNGVGVRVAFFSALEESEKINETDEKEEEEMSDNSNSDSVEPDSDVNNSEEQSTLETSIDEGDAVATHIKNSPKLLSKEEFIAFLKTFKNVSGEETVCTTVGMVGYPNVGKSSTINSLISRKKVQVSATAGKTKHFQTLMVDSDLCLCDCPGLVFPNFISTKADMVINGILPVDQLTDHVAPVTLVANLIPRTVLESTYSIIIPPPPEGRDPSSPPTAEEFLNAHGYMRGFMTQRGLPDNARSSRYVLKDFLCGRLLYCHPPLGVDAQEFQKHSIRPIPDSPPRPASQPLKNSSSKSEDIDRSFFSLSTGQAHIKGVTRVSNYSMLSQPSGSMTNKPWKKHYNRNKKEKLRRIYSTADK